MHGAFWGLLIILYYKRWLEHIPYCLHAIKMYPFFLMGTFFSRYKAFKDKVINSNHLFTIAIIGYILCLMYQHIMPVKLNFTGCFAIIILINIFVKYNHYIPQRLSFIGKHSLEIYIFHWFFLPTLDSLGNWLSVQSIGINKNFIVLFCITLIISMPIIYICILLSKIIHNSRLLNIVCFGSFK